VVEYLNKRLLQYHENFILKLNEQNVAYTSQHKYTALLTFIARVIYTCFDPKGQQKISGWPFEPAKHLEQPKAAHEWFRPHLLKIFQ